MINVLAGINSTGYGSFASCLVAAMDEANMQPALLPIGGVECERHHARHIESAIERGRRFNPRHPSLRIWHPFAMAEHVGSPRYGYTFFELDRLNPDEVHHLNSLDHLFVPTQWAQQVCHDSGVTVPMTVVRPGVDQVLFHPRVKPCPIPGAGPETMIFANVGKWSLNKGHDILLRVFNEAFSPDDDVMLVVAAHNPLRFPGFDGPRESAAWTELYMDSPMGRSGKIRIVPGRFGSKAELASIMAASHAGIFLARGEGFNLPAAEMAAMGKPLVMTDCTAHSEYVDVAHVVRVTEMEPAEDGFFFRADNPPWCGRPGQWGVLGPEQVEMAAHHCRQLWQQHRDGNLLPNVSGIQRFKQWTYARAAGDIGRVVRV